MITQHLPEASRRNGSLLALGVVLALAVLVQSRGAFAAPHNPLTQHYEDPDLAKAAYCLPVLQWQQASGADAGDGAAARLQRAHAIDGLARYLAKAPATDASIAAAVRGRGDTAMASKQLAACTTNTLGNAAVQACIAASDIGKAMQSCANLAFLPL